MVRKSKAREAKRVHEYIKTLYESNPVWSDDSMAGLTGIRRKDFIINMDHPDHAEVHKVKETVTHECVHLTHGSPQFNLADPKMDEKRQAEEDFTEGVTAALLANPVWQMAITQWLLLECWGLILEARKKGLSFL